jgi:hypothetical protein
MTYKEPQTCAWSQEDPDGDCWNTDCGETFCVTDGTPRENKMSFCCFCGKTLNEVPFADEEDGEE